MAKYIYIYIDKRVFHFITKGKSYMYIYICVGGNYTLIILYRKIIYIYINPYRLYK